VKYFGFTHLNVDLNDGIKLHCLLGHDGAGKLIVGD
jgi:hypothetical protein